MKIKIGFTLAEVLITLGIIGIVAAMSIPSLINKVQEITFKSKLKKSYSLLSQTVKLMLADDNAYMGKCRINDSKCLGEMFGKYMKFVNAETGTSYFKGCWEDSYTPTFQNPNTVPQQQTELCTCSIWNGKTRIKMTKATQSMSSPTFWLMLTGQNCPTNTALTDLFFT